MSRAAASGDGATVTIGIVFLDIGGVLYDDTVYARAWNRALREAGARFTDDEFEEEYTRARTEQSGSFARSWHYPPSALYEDAIPCLEELREEYRLGVIANQPGEVRSAMRRDGLDRFFEVWGVSDELGVGKPDPRLFELAARTAGVPPTSAVMVGDRLDYDVRPAKLVGMRAIWMLRGEAPDRPTAEQLDEADGSISTLAELPGELYRLSAA